MLSQSADFPSFLRLNNIYLYLYLPTSAEDEGRDAPEGQTDGTGGAG